MSAVATVRRGAKAILDAAGVLPEHRDEEMWSLAERDASAVIESLKVEHAVLWDDERKSPGAFNRRVTPLERKQIPRDAASHDGHRLEEARIYASTTIRRICMDCGIEIDPYRPACAHTGTVDFHTDYWVCRACGHREETPHA